MTHISLPALGMVTIPARTGETKLHRFCSSRLQKSAEMVRFWLQRVESGLNFDLHLVKIKTFFGFHLYLGEFGLVSTSIFEN